MITSASRRRLLLLADYWSTVPGAVDHMAVCQAIGACPKCAVIVCAEDLRVAVSNSPDEDEAVAFADDTQSAAKGARPDHEKAHRPKGEK